MKLFVLILSLLLIVTVYGDNNGTTENPGTTNKPTVHTTPSPAGTTPSHESTTTMTPAEECASRNSSCKECLGLAQCLWCNSNKKCLLYPSGDVLPHSDLCPLDHARWGVCWVNFEVLIIVMASIGSILLLSVVICICCCCCKRKSSSTFDKEDAKFERKKMERKAKNDEKRAERRQKTDEIRRKYGLLKDDNQYQRFDQA